MITTCCECLFCPDGEIIDLSFLLSLVLRVCAFNGLNQTAYERAQMFPFLL